MAIDTFSNEGHKAPRVLRSLLSRPSSLKQGERVGHFVMPVNSLVVDSTLKQSKNITIPHFLVVSSSSYFWLEVRGMAYTIIGSKFMLLSSMHAQLYYMYITLK